MIYCRWAVILAPKFKEFSLFSSSSSSRDITCSLPTLPSITYPSLLPQMNLPQYKLFAVLNFHVSVINLPPLESSYLYLLTSYLISDCCLSSPLQILKASSERRYNIIGNCNTSINCVSRQKKNYMSSFCSMK